MAVNRGQWGELLVPGAKAVYVDTYNELPATYPEIFNVDTSGRAFEDDLVATGMPIAVSRPEGEPIAFDRPKFRGKVRYLHAGFGLGYEITEEAVDDDLYKVLNSTAAANLARSMRETEEVVAANVFNLAFTSTLSYDGLTVFNTAHTLVGGATLPNRPTPDVDLSVAALKSATERYFNLKTDRGIRINMAPERLVVNHNNWWAAQEILGTTQVTGASSGGEVDSVISAQAKNVTTMMGLRPIMWRYLTDDGAWFLMASRAQTRARFYWRKKPMMVNGFMARERVAWFGIIARLSAGITDWHGLDGSSGA